MLSCWLRDSEAIDLQHQQWHLHFARIGTIRRISTQNRMTRQQAKCFAESPDHVSIEEALCRGVAGFVGQQRKVRPQQVTQRRWKRRQASKQPWRRGDWPALSIPDFQTQNNGESRHGYRSWSIRQIVRRNDLIREGTELQHCVGTYDDKCKSGRTSIWSLKSHGLQRLKLICGRDGGSRAHFPLLPRARNRHDFSKTALDSRERPVQTEIDSPQHHVKDQQHQSNRQQV